MVLAVDLMDPRCPQKSAVVPLKPMHDRNDFTSRRVRLDLPTPVLLWRIAPGRVPPDGTKMPARCRDANCLRWAIYAIARNL